MCSSDLFPSHDTREERKSALAEKGKLRDNFSPETSLAEAFGAEDL